MDAVDADLPNGAFRLNLTQYLRLGGRWQPASLKLRLAGLGRMCRLLAIGLSGILRPLATALVLLGLTSCADSWSWHQKITVSVNTPTGVRSGSSVLRATLRRKGGWWAPPEARGVESGLSGEAVVVEIVPGKYLFALLKKMPLAYQVFFPNEAPLEVASRLGILREKRELAANQFPILVTFVDVHDPTSVRIVNPYDLASIFGKGYTLNSISIETTDERQTTGEILKILQWLTSYPEQPVLPNLRPTDFSSEAKLRHGDFMKK